MYCLLKIQYCFSVNQQQAKQSLQSKQLSRYIELEQFQAVEEKMILYISTLLSDSYNSWEGLLSFNVQLR